MGGIGSDLWGASQLELTHFFDSKGNISLHGELDGDSLNFCGSLGASKTGNQQTLWYREKPHFPIQLFYHFVTRRSSTESLVMNDIETLRRKSVFPCGN